MQCKPQVVTLFLELGDSCGRINAIIIYLGKLLDEVAAEKLAKFDSVIGDKFNSQLASSKGVGQVLQISVERNVTGRVPQGLVIGPLLFLIYYINCLPLNINYKILDLPTTVSSIERFKVGIEKRLYLTKLNAGK